MGGSEPSPSYSHIGSHTETTQIEFDPAVISYPQLLSVFFTIHNPHAVKSSTQYMSVIFPHDDEQEKLCREAKSELEAKTGRKVFTAIERHKPSDMTLAEGYHQKYDLRRCKRILAALNLRTDAELIDSSPAARLNGYIGGHGRYEDLLKEIDTFGLSDEAKAELERMLGRGHR